MKKYVAYIFSFTYNFYMWSFEDLDIPEELRDAFFKIVQFNKLDDPTGLYSRKQRPARRLFSKLGLRSLMVKWQSLYNGFSSSRKTAWTNYWISLPFGGHGGSNGYPGSGFSAFIYVNAPRYKAGLDLILDPYPIPSLNSSISYTIINLFYEFSKIIWAEYLGLFVAFARNAGSSDQMLVFTSSDGITWTQQTVPYDVGTPIADYSETLGIIFYISNTNPLKVYFSYNAIDWFSQTLPDIDSVSDVCVKSPFNIFLAVGAYSGNLKTLISYDGVNWSDYSDGSTPIFDRVTYNPRLFSYIGARFDYPTLYFYTSSDGITWNEIDSVYATFFLDVYGDGLVNRNLFAPLLSGSNVFAFSTVLSSFSLSPISGFEQLMPFKFIPYFNCYLGFGYNGSNGRLLSTHDIENFDDFGVDTAIGINDLAYSPSLSKLCFTQGGKIFYADLT